MRMYRTINCFADGSRLGTETDTKLHTDCEALFQTQLRKFSKVEECCFKKGPLGHNSLPILSPRFQKRWTFPVQKAHSVSKFVPLQSMTS